MNPFYKRLFTFGELVQYFGRMNHVNYEDYFEIEHPGHPVFIHGDRVKPRLNFTKPCPRKERARIMGIFNECFG
ncbi:hypothetical protein MUY27_05590 [Mucilaginibacter sp. RS28]|uniref:Uncharacterized protein n=1 Tax=Mucilaginibacter straminoryzae TaxID=2932774 RepID=A0A9X1X1L8_9SPHI|nr:hypothetical protein [Mucilaginibacter straminoryzae]MCJ8209171.1 hypothetical protein [Mucilaginibacter straminoryzae]